MLPPDDLAGGLANLLANPYFSAAEHPDGPKPPQPQWRGVMISAPAEIVLSLRDPMVILRGCYRISGANYPAKDRLKLIAVDVATKREYTGGAGQRDSSPDVPPPPSDPPDPETIKRMVFSGFFNADLMGTLKLPFTSGTYRIRAEFGNIPSNEITVKITVK